MPHLVSRVGLALLALALCSVSFADEADMARGIGDKQLAQIGQRWATDFAYEFESANFADNEVFAGLVKSPEYAAWMAKRDARTP